MNRLLLCGLAGVVIAGCSSGHTDVGSRTEDAASKPPSARVTTVASPARTVTFARLKQAVVQIANADGIVAVAGGLWVKTDDGRAVRVDPATNKITTQVSLDHVSDRSDYCQGIGTDGKTVWACATENDGTALAQIEPASAHVLRRVKIGKLFDQLSLPATAPASGPSPATAPLFASSIRAPDARRVIHSAPFASNSPLTAIA